MQYAFIFRLGGVWHGQKSATIVLTELTTLLLRNNYATMTGLGFLIQINDKHSGCFTQPVLCSSQERKTDKTTHFQFVTVFQSFESGLINFAGFGVQNTPT